MAKFKGITLDETKDGKAATINIMGDFVYFKYGGSQKYETWDSDQPKSQTLGGEVLVANGTLKDLGIVGIQITEKITRGVILGPRLVVTTIELFGEKQSKDQNPPILKTVKIETALKEQMDATTLSTYMVDAVTQKADGQYSVRL